MKKCAPYNPKRSGLPDIHFFTLCALGFLKAAGSRVPWSQSFITEPTWWGMQKCMHACMRIVSSKCRYTSMSHQDKWCKFCYLIGLAFPASPCAFFSAFCRSPFLAMAPLVFLLVILLICDDEADGGKTRRLFLFSLGVLGFSFWT